MKNIKAIFIDLDGTLTNSNGVVSVEAIEKLKELINKGIKVVIATGRNYIQAKLITKDIEGLWYITNNGAYVVNDKEEAVLIKGLEKNMFLNFLDETLKIKDLNLFIQNQERILTNSTKLERFLLIFQNQFFKNLSFKKIKGFLNKEASLGHIVRTVKNPLEFFETSKELWLKVLVLGNEKEISFLADKYKNEFSISFSGLGNIEVNAKGVSKGEAIKEVCKMNDISLENTLCFGDSGNDIEMFKAVGISVVMGNSHVEELHKTSKFKTKTNDENGVYYFLKEHF